MQISVEEISQVERRLTIIVPVERFEEAYKKAMNHLAKNANIKGFRPGKVPLSYLTKRFGNEAEREAFSQVIQDSVHAALNEKKLYPVNTPSVEPKVMVPEKPLEFVVSFEILPEISEVKFNLENVEKLKIEISEEDIERVIKQLQKQYGEWTLVEREAKLKDRVVINYYTEAEGPAKKNQNVPIELGSKMMIQGFEEGLLGVKKGEQKTLNLTYPEDYHREDLKGKPDSFVIDVLEIYEPNIPEVNEEFIKSFGIKSGSLEDLKKQIRETLELERDREIKEKLKDQVFKAVLAQNPIVIPNSLVENEAKQIHDEVYKQEHNHANHSKEELDNFKEMAKKRVSLGLLLSQYIKQIDMKPDKDRFKARIREIASIYEHPDEVIQWLSTNEERRASIESQIMEDQVLDKLIENIPIVEKTLSYSELKGIKE